MGVYFLLTKLIISIDHSSGKKEKELIKVEMKVNSNKKKKKPISYIIIMVWDKALVTANETFKVIHQIKFGNVNLFIRNKNFN